MMSLNQSKGVLVASLIVLATLLGIVAAIARLSSWKPGSMCR